MANIHEAVGHQVLRLNWLGDWGTQFGLLAFGLRNGNLEQILAEKNPMQELYNIYVEVNRQVEAEPEVGIEARALFAQLETGNEDLRTQWEMIRNVTIKELEKVYARLGIKFDHYHGEAMYADAKVDF